MSGYARAYRSRWEHPLFKSKQEAAVWAWMCDTARFRRHSFQTRFGLVTLERGQLLTSERQIAEDFGLHKNTVRRLISTMQRDGMVSLNRDHAASRAGTIISILNFEKYQAPSDNSDEDGDQGGTGNGTKTGPRRDHNGTTREEREEREEGRKKEDSPSDSSISDPSARPSPSTSLTLLPATDEVSDAFEAFDAVRREFTPNARSIELGADRRKKLALRLGEIGGPTGWAEVVASIRGSPFLRGETSRNGFVKLDWLLEPANLRKVREGNYDHHGNRGASGPAQPVRTAPVAAARVARDLLGLNG